MGGGSPSSLCSAFLWGSSLVILLASSYCGLRWGLGSPGASCFLEFLG